MAAEERAGEPGSPDPHGVPGAGSEDPYSVCLSGQQAWWTELQERSPGCCPSGSALVDSLPPTPGLSLSELVVPLASSLGATNAASPRPGRRDTPWLALPSWSPRGAPASHAPSRPGRTMGAEISILGLFSAEVRARVPW